MLVTPGRDLPRGCRLRIVEAAQIARRTKRASGRGQRDNARHGRSAEGRSPGDGRCKKSIMKRPEPRPLLGTTTDREAAFPDIESMSVIIEQDKYGHYSKDGLQRKSTYTRASMPRFARCLNPRCQQGGLDLQMQTNGSQQRNLHV